MFSKNLESSKWKFHFIISTIISYYITLDINTVLSVIGFFHFWKVFQHRHFFQIFSRHQELISCHFTDDPRSSSTWNDKCVYFVSSATFAALKMHLFRILKLHIFYKSYRAAHTETGALSMRDSNYNIIGLNNRKDKTTFLFF